MDTASDNPLSMLRAGLIGLAASGKTTLFDLLTHAADGSRAHRRAEAHIGVSRVPDARLDQLVALLRPERRVPATVELADMAAGRADPKGLVDVSAYRVADALLHVVRAFRDPAVAHPQGSVNPARDARFVEDELVLADLAVAERRLERLERDVRKNPSADLRAEQDVLGTCRSALESGHALRTLDLSGDAARRLRGFQFLSAKPLLLVVNLDEADVGMTRPGGLAVGLDPFLRETRAAAVGVCAKTELEIGRLEPADARAFMADLGLAESGLDRVIRAAYELLGYISFFTVANDECRAWSVPRRTTALEAAGAIHTDIQRGFVRAEVVPVDRLLARGSLAASRDHGELRLEGKDYIVSDGDVITFRFAT
jgi:hypothetical protein